MLIAYPIRRLIAYPIREALALIAYPIRRLIAYPIREVALIAYPIRRLIAYPIRGEVERELRAVRWRAAAARVAKAKQDLQGDVSALVLERDQVDRHLKLRPGFLEVA